MIENSPPQFVLWHSEPQMPPAKPKKIPCNISGVPIDPHNPDIWMDYETARSLADQHNLHVGFDLGTEPRPDGLSIFCLDLDGVRNPATGDWDQFAHDMVNTFKGAFMEISYSETGMHIWGLCRADQLVHKCIKFADNKAEFYTINTKRFIALGSAQQGNIEIDWTETLKSVVPDKEITEIEMHHTGPDPSWTLGHLSTQQIIDKARNARGSDASLFANTPRFSDLFDGNEKILAGFYPSESGQPYDASAAEQTKAYPIYPLIYITVWDYSYI